MKDGKKALKYGIFFKTTMQANFKVFEETILPQTIYITSNKEISITASHKLKLSNPNKGAY